jgi:hypothetical protein
VIADVAISLLAILLALFAGVMAAAANDESTNAGVTPAEWLTLIAFVVLVPAQIGSLVGIYLLKNWSRWLFAGSLSLLHLASLITSLFDFAGGWGFPNTLGDISATIDGVIIGLIFFSTLASEFEPASSAPILPA